MTSNRPIEDWRHLIGDLPATGAILERLPQSAEVIPFKGRSHRLKNSHTLNKTGIGRSLKQQERKVNNEA